MNDPASGCFRCRRDRHCPGCPNEVKRDMLKTLEQSTGASVVMLLFIILFSLLGEKLCTSLLTLIN